MKNKTKNKTIFSLFRKNNFIKKNIVEIINKENNKRKYKILSEYGAIPKEQLRKELLKYDFDFPEKLIEFWIGFGGGELFQGENILYPLHTNNDLIESMIYYNDKCIKENMKNYYFIFSSDTVNHTAFNKKTHEIVCFDNNFNIRWKFKNFLKWFKYVKKIQG